MIYSNHDISHTVTYRTEIRHGEIQKKGRYNGIIVYTHTDFNFFMHYTAGKAQKKNNGGNADAQKSKKQNDQRGENENVRINQQIY